MIDELNMGFEVSSGRKTRFGVYLPRELVNKLDELINITRIGSRSKLVQEALRLFIAEHRWTMGGYVAGALCVLYNHEVESVDEKLTDVQHEFIDVVVSSMHVHLDRETCMLIVAVRGENSRVRELYNKLASTRGVLLVRPVLLEARSVNDKEA